MSFYPPDRPVPAELRTSRFAARPLRVADATIDHEAFVASPDTIRVHSGGRWPAENFTVADNRPLAAQHEAAHAARENFAFLLLDPLLTISLGCFYLLPLQPFLQQVNAPPAFQSQIAADAVMATFWVRQSERDTGLDRVVITAVQRWLEIDWEFSTIMWRVNSQEHESLQAFRALGWQRLLSIDLDHPPHCYLLYGTPSAGA